MVLSSLPTKNLSSSINIILVSVILLPPNFPSVALVMVSKTVTLLSSSDAKAAVLPLGERPTL